MWPLLIRSRPPVGFRYNSLLVVADLPNVYRGVIKLSPMDSCFHFESDVRVIINSLCGDGNIPYIKRVCDKLGMSPLRSFYNVAGMPLRAFLGVIRPVVLKIWVKSDVPTIEEIMGFSGGYFANGY